MSPQEVYRNTGEAVTITSDTPINGYDKYVFQAVDGEEKVAIKIFKTNDEYEQELYTTRANRIQNELAAYSVLQSSPLGPHIPKLRFLIQDERDECIGLAVDWEEGDIIATLDEPVIPREEVEKLKLSISETIAQGIIPNGDIILSHNIAFNPSRVPALWLTECELEDDEYNKEIYNWFLSDSFASLDELAI